MSILLVLCVPSFIAVVMCTAGYTGSVLHPRMGKQEDSAG